MGTDDYLYDDPVDEDEDGAYAVYEDVARRARQHAEDVLVDLDDAEPEPPAPGRWHVMRARLARAIRVLALVAILGAAIAALLILRGILAGDGSAEGDGPAATAPALDAPPVTWPAQVQPRAHTVPALIKDTLSRTGEAHGYRFEGAAGTTWRITVEPRAESALDPLITLYGPSGDEIALADDRSAGDLTAEIVLTLPESGPYRLLVQSSQGGITTGDYLLSLWPE
jgi:hypothetical protein